MDLSSAPDIPLACLDMIRPCLESSMLRIVLVRRVCTLSHSYTKRALISCHYVVGSWTNQIYIRIDKLRLHYLTSGHIAMGIWEDITTNFQACLSCCLYFFPIPNWRRSTTTYHIPPNEMSTVT